MFRPSEESQKLKTQTLTLSVVCLFISMAGVLPQKIALIGLDLSMSQDISGWFLLVLTTYIFIKFVVSLGLEVFKEKLPQLIALKTSRTIGNTFGLTQQEISDHEQMNIYEDELRGTVSGEAEDIRIKNQEIISNYETVYTKLHNSWVYLTDYILPVLLCLFATYSLYSFLLTGEAVKFT